MLLSYFCLGLWRRQAPLMNETWFWSHRIHVLLPIVLSFPGNLSNQEQLVADILPWHHASSWGLPRTNVERWWRYAWTRALSGRYNGQLGLFHDPGSTESMVDQCWWSLTRGSSLNHVTASREGHEPRISSEHTTVMNSSGGCGGVVKVGVFKTTGISTRSRSHI